MTDKILIVDDDRNICEILAFNLKNEGFDVECAHSAEEALGKSPENFALILLDVMMAGMSGYKMAEKLRQQRIGTPIIFLTAKDTENDMLTGFSVGGDDYISKPFSIKELVARTKAVLKRSNLLSENNAGNTNLTFDNLSINLETKEVWVNEEKVLLTKTEFELLVLLSSNSNRIFSREDIIDIVWKDTPYITERTVDVHITRLRKKLGDYASVITNRSGYGYRFDISNL
ncbi:MAG: response regulator transcription factor [Prevotellaceae bacterium]|jgi:DNA-binding response OmpR family regulator|nr:response regulator transcription factor [Prevotellaceae bacterium]